MGKNSIKYKFLEGTGTQIAYDLKFKYFFAPNWTLTNSGPSSNLNLIQVINQSYFLFSLH